MKRLKVGLDSYSLKPLGLSPFELLDWAGRHGAEGVQFSEPPLVKGRMPDKRGLQDLAAAARGLGLYLEWGGAEHIPFDLSSWKPKKTFETNRRAAEQAAVLGARTVRSCSGGLMRWQDDSLPTEVLLRETARSLREQRPMLEDYGITLAIETHFEFTTFELARLLDMCEAPPGGALGICLDTMNLLTMLEDPVQATRRILPWVVTTHIKDGAIVLSEEGFITFPAEAGKGSLDFSSIFKVLSGRPGVRLSLEDHGGHFLVPIFKPGFLAKFPDLTTAELSLLLAATQKARARLESGGLSILDREHWPGVCEERVKAGLKAVKRIASRAGKTGPLEKDE